MAVGINKVKICNMALSHCGSKTNIESIDEKGVAAQCKLWYDTALEQTLEAFDWGFARKTQTLTAHSVAAPENRYAFRYQVPADCVAARLIENPAGPAADAIAYRVENAGDDTLCILTNQEDAVLIYTYRILAVPLYTMQFVEALALALGARIAYKITGKPSVVSNLNKAFASKVIDAEIANIDSSVPPAEREAETIRARS